MGTKTHRSLWAAQKVREFAPLGKLKSTLLALAMHANPDGESCYPSINLLIQETGHSRSTIKRHIKELTTKGELKVIRQGRNGRANLYSIECCKKSLPIEKLPATTQDLQALQIKMPLPPARDPDERIELRSPETIEMLRQLADKLKMTGT